MVNNQNINSYGYVAGILTRKNPPLSIQQQGQVSALESTQTEANESALCVARLRKRRIT